MNPLLKVAAAVVAALVAVVVSTAVAERLEDPRRP